MAISGPIALYANLPIEPQYYKPWRFVITAIALGVTTTITATIPSITNLNYVLGQQIRLVIPPQFGCRQLNGHTAYVLSVTLPNQVTVSIDSSHGVDPYIASSATTPAQILAIGDLNFGYISNSGRVIFNPGIPGSFQNISPN